MSGKAEVGAAALVADEPPLRVLSEAPVYTCADGLADAGRRLVSMLATRGLVVTQAQSV